MYIEFFYLLFILAITTLVLSFLKTDGYDARVIFTLTAAIMFMALAFGSFYVEKTDPATNTTMAIYSPSFAYTCLYFVAMAVVRLVIIVTALLTTKDLETNVESYDTNE